MGLVSQKKLSSISVKTFPDVSLRSYSNFPVKSPPAMYFRAQLGKAGMGLAKIIFPITSGYTRRVVQYRAHFVQMHPSREFATFLPHYFSQSVYGSRGI